MIALRVLMMLAVCASVATMVVAGVNDDGGAVLLGFVTLMLFIFCTSTTYAQGHRRVPYHKMTYQQQLRAGTTYHLLGFRTFLNTQVLFVEESNTGDCLTLRVENGPVPPAYFTLVGGEPMAVLLFLHLPGRTK